MCIKFKKWDHEKTVEFVNKIDNDKVLQLERNIHLVCIDNVRERQFNLKGRVMVFF